jgi:hypothetical protein
MARQEWLHAAACILPAERARIGRFHFAQDARMAMVRGRGRLLLALLLLIYIFFLLQAGRLLIRLAVADVLGLAPASIDLRRTRENKPYLVGRSIDC